MSHYRAQIDNAFIEHLSKNNLKTEHRLYLDKLQDESDSSNYYKTKFNLQYFNDSLILLYYQKSKTLCDNDSILMAKTGAALLSRGQPGRTEQWFKLKDPQKMSNDMRSVTDIYLGVANPNTLSPDHFPSQSQQAFSRYKRLYNKKPFIAGALSVAIPGLGKLYAGKTRSFLATLLINATYGAQTAESYRKLGASHPLTIINASGLLVFYLSNVYGSYQSVKQQRYEYKKQFLIDATRFYN